MNGQELEEAIGLLSKKANTPRPVRWLARFLWLSLVALPFILGFVPWYQNVRGEGQVIAFDPLGRRQTVEAPIDGRIIRWWVAESSKVKKGDPLFEITDNDPVIISRFNDQIQAQADKKKAAEAKILSFTQQIASYEMARTFAMSAARDMVRMADQRVTSAERAVDAAEITLETSKLNLDRQQLLRDDRVPLNSQRDLELAKLSKMKAEAELASKHASLEAAKSDRSAKLAEVEKISAYVDVDVSSAEAKRESARSDAASADNSRISLESKRAQQQTQRVEAPLDGTVLKLMANPGSEYVKKGDPIVVIVPDFADTAVELWIDGNDVPLLSTGRHVRLQFEGWPAVQVAGWPSVAVGTFGGEVRLIDATDDGRGRFRVVIVPDTVGDNEWPGSRFLRQGVQARGWILLEEVTLGFEVWRNLNGFPPLNLDASLGKIKPKQK